MNKLAAILTVPFVCAAVAGCSSSTKKADSKAAAPVAPGYVTKSSGSFKLQPYKEVVLENGLKIIYINDTTLPRVSLTLLMKTGSMQEAAEKAGLNALTAYLLEQGSQSADAMKIADEMGQLGSALDVNPGADVTTIYADSLTTGADTLLKIFSDVVMNPAFKDSEIGRMRSQMLASLQKKIDTPSSYADSQADLFLYGSHPYGRDVNGTPEGLRAITKQDIIKHFLTFYRPNNASLAVVGNFKEEYEKNVQDIFGKWTKRTIPVVKTEAAPEIDSLQVKLIVKKGLQQTQIRIMQLGFARNSPDYLTLRLGNEILGGGFASRLNQKVRDDQGLTYSIYSGFDFRKERGSFDISTFTKNETAAKTLEESLAVLTDFVNKGAQETEVAAGRSQLVGQFPRAIETADRLAYNILALDFFGISVDYLTSFNKTVSAIRAKETNEAVMRSLKPGKMKVLIYGDESIISQFEKYKPEVVRLK
ncbi:MAG TPA: pitrilysin family protein [Bdellovibrio sp.]